MLSAGTKFLLIALFCYRCSGDELNKRFVGRYHLVPPHGWMNDPNGFCKFQDWYHAFYQYNPETSQEAGIAHWGHAKSKDLMTWIHQPIALYPDKPYDITGVFSGSAIIVNNTMFLLYTGNVRNPGQTPDTEQRQALASSTDGVHFTKYAGNPVIKAEEHQPDIRDPKVWKHGDLYYMVLGNSKNGLGQVLLYSSKDLISWIEVTTLAQSDGSLGTMWECPDFFELNGYFVLVMSPQNMEASGDKYRNLYQTGYIVGNFDYETHVFEQKTQFRELDHGHDFYATQSILDDDDRRIEVGWCDTWGDAYPERDDGFTGHMTIPRELSLSKDLRLIQKPVKEISVAHDHLLYSGEAQGGHTVQLEDKAGEIRITASEDQDFNLFIESINASVSISYDRLKHKVTLDRGGEDGVRRTEWKPADKLKWYILVDASSIELFCGDGEVTFTSRFFPYGDITIRLGDNVQVDNLSVISMKRTVSFH